MSEIPWLWTEQGTECKDARVQAALRTALLATFWANLEVITSEASTANIRKKLASEEFSTS